MEPLNNDTKLQLMINWLKATIDIFPKKFILSQAVTVLDSRFHIETIIARLENYQAKKMFGAAFKGEYINAYALRKWYQANEQNLIGQMTTVPVMTNQLNAEDYNETEPNEKPQ